MEKAFKQGRVGPAMLEQAQRALIAGSKSFDAANPGFRVSARVRLGINKASVVGKAGRLIKYGGKI